MEFMRLVPGSICELRECHYQNIERYSGSYSVPVNGNIVASPVELMPERFATW
jgi:hypothetical protein